MNAFPFDHNILLALCIFFIPWQTDLALYGRNADDVNTMFLKVEFPLYLCKTLILKETLSFSSCLTVPNELFAA